MNILIKGALGCLALTISSHAAQLINVDYTAHLNPTFSVKTGTAYQV